MCWVKNCGAKHTGLVEVAFGDKVWLCDICTAWVISQRLAGLKVYTEEDFVLVAAANWDPDEEWEIKTVWGG